MTTLQQLINTVTADSEEDVTKLLQMMNPTTAEEMGPVYTEVLGYNPITYFDEKLVEAQIDKVIPYAPNKAGQILVNKKKEIVSSTMALCKDARDMWLQSSLQTTIRDYISVDEWDEEDMEDAFDITDGFSYDSDEEDDDSGYTYESDGDDEEDEPFGFEDDDEED